MTYNYSNLDRNNLKWFSNDPTRATLLSIRVTGGIIRGLRNIQIDFSYPITAIAGRNGSGKTTILSLAACAFHNKPTGFCLPERKNPYYTYSDFFIQTAEETSIAGILIHYRFLHDKWYSPKDPDGRIGAKWQSMRKRYGGRWSNYDRRVNRTVVYLGINRIVPHAERSISKTYRNRYVDVETQGWEDEVKQVVGRVLGIDYDSFSHKQHSKYRIPIVIRNICTYSGFNMGAGEESLFELFSIIKECPDGSLIIIDEIELGLHESAQEKLIKELKQLCEKRKIQIICTTHSPRILDSLPPEGRIFLERGKGTINVIPGISSAFATGKLTGHSHVELDVLVEDDTAKLIVETCLTDEVRSRVNVIVVGSHTAVMYHLAARYKEKKVCRICAILDGDKKSSKATCVSDFQKAIENTKDQEKNNVWVEKHLSFLPGTDWPERWVVSQKGVEGINLLSQEWRVTPDRVEEVLNAAKRAAKHNEFYAAAEELSFDERIVTYAMIRAAFESNLNEREALANYIEGFLE